MAALGIDASELIRERRQRRTPDSRHGTSAIRWNHRIEIAPVGKVQQIEPDVVTGLVIGDHRIPTRIAAYASPIGIRRIASRHVRGAATGFPMLGEGICAPCGEGVAWCVGGYVALR